MALHHEAREPDVARRAALHSCRSQSSPDSSSPSSEFSPPSSSSVSARRAFLEDEDTRRRSAPHPAALPCLDEEESIASCDGTWSTPPQQRSISAGQQLPLRKRDEEVEGGKRSPAASSATAAVAVDEEKQKFHKYSDLLAAACARQLASVEDGAGRPLTKLCAHPEVRALMEEKAKKDGVQLEALQIVQWRDAVFEVYKDAKNVHHVVTLKIPKTSSEYAAYTRLRRVELVNCCPEIAQMPLVAPHTPAKPNFRANGMEAEKEKRNRVSTWGGNDRVQRIAGAVVSRSVVVSEAEVSRYHSEDSLRDRATTSKMTMACMRPCPMSMSVGHLAALGIFTPAARPAEMTSTGAVLKMLPPTALPIPAGARKAPVKKPLTKEEMLKVKRNRITTWGGNGRVQMITGAVVSSSVVVRPTAVAKPRGPAQTAAATSAHSQTSDKKQKTESYRKMFAAVDDQMNRQSAMADSPMEADYVFVEADGHRELAEGGKPERAAFWAAWRKDLRGMFQYIREYECGEVDEKWYLFDVKPAEETIFGNAFARYVEN